MVKLVGMIPHLPPLRYRLVPPIHTADTFYLPYGWGLAALTHFQDGRTTFHLSNGACSCCGLLYPRLESFHFAVKGGFDKPVIVRLSSNATRMLWQDHEKAPFDHGDRIRCERLAGKRGKMLCAKRIAGCNADGLRSELDLTREQLSVQLCHIFNVPESERPSIFC